MRVIITIILLTVYGASQGQLVQQTLPEKTRVLFLLDGSGSMLAKWGETTRIEVAKSLLCELVDSLKVNRKLELGLRVYGHLYSRQTRNCKDTRLEVGFSKNNHQQIINKLQTIKPKGTTPIAYSLEQAANDFPQPKGYRHIVIIITDGIESCNGDPCAVSLQLQKKGIFLKPFIIGIGMGKSFKNEFGCIGEFYDADDITSFRTALEKAITTTLEKTTVSVELLDEMGRPNETNINVSFINNFTKEPAFDFVHYRDRNGQPDSVEVDPVLSYDITANTIPPVTKKDVHFKPSAHNKVSIKCPRGSLNIIQKDASSYPKGVQALIYKNGRLIHTQSVNSDQKYLSGEYSVELLTVPRRKFKNVKIRPREATNLNLKSPGILNIVNNSAGFGSIYELTENGTQTWVYDLEHDKSRVTLTLQPGKYKIVFRVDGAPGSKYTSIKKVTIIEGRSQLLKMF